MVARNLFAIDSEALTVTYSRTQNVGDSVFNNSSSPNGTQYIFNAGYSTRKVTVEDTGGSSETLEDDKLSSHVVTDGAGLVPDGTSIEGESIIRLQAMDADGTPSGPIINIYVLSQNGDTADVWGFASDTLLVPGTSYLKVGGSNIGSTDYANYQTPWLVTVDGTDGNDIIRTGYMDVGGDQVDGNDGTNEAIYGYDGDDFIDGGLGTDTIYGGKGDDTLIGGAGADVLDGGDGIDLADYSTSTGGVKVSLERGAAAGADGQGDTLRDIENLRGSEYDDVLLGDDEDNQIDGGAGSDWIEGGKGKDTLIGGAGDDWLDGGDNEDSLTGDAGNDTLLGGDGKDTLDGGTGADLIEGGKDDDSILGGAGDDTLLGGEGKDTIQGGDGDDSIEGGDDDDILIGGLGVDTIHGGEGDDTLYGGNEGEFLSGDEGEDVVVGGHGDDTLLGGADDDTVYGGLGDDSISGGEGDDWLIGAAGDDTLDGGLGEDTLQGGDGADSFIIGKADYSALGTTEDVVAALLRENLADLSGWTSKKIDELFPDDEDEDDDYDDDDDDGHAASNLDIAAIGDAVRDVLPSFLGGLTNDAIVGLVETTLTGLVAADPFGHLEADDVSKLIKDLVKPLYGKTVANRVEDAVEDNIDSQYDALDNLLNPPEISEKDLLELAQHVTIEDFEIGTDVLVLSSHDYLGKVGLSTNDIRVSDTEGDGTGDAILHLPDGSTITLRNISALSLDPETLETMGFLESDDTSDFQNPFLTAAGKIFGGGGNDELVGSLNDESFSGGTGNDTVFGGGGADTIYGGEGNDLIEGGDGDDVLYTGTGDDTLLGGEGNDVLNNSSGDDSLSGGAGDDKLVASAGDDTLEGGADNDTLIGGIDNDSLDGGDGNDLLKGDFEVNGLIEDNQLFAYEYYELDGLTSLNTLADAGFTSGTENDNTPDGEGVVGSIDPGALDSYHGGDGNTFAVKLATNLTVTHGGTYTFDLTSDDGAQIYIDGVLLNDNDGVHSGKTTTESITLTGGDHLIEILYFDKESSETLSVDITGPDTNGITIGLEEANLSTSFDDYLIGGAGDDTLYGGLGDDTFVYTPGDGHDVIEDFNTGNTGTLSDGRSTNNDFINLSGYYDHISELYADQADDGILNQSNSDADYSNNTKFGTGSLTFTGAQSNSSFYTTENTGVVCFTSGTAIRTPAGEVSIDDLKIGDLVCTLDNGPQPIRWIGRREVGAEELAADEKMRPVLIPQGMFGAQRDLLVSRQHAILVEDDLLARAIHLADAKGSQARVAHGKKQVTYIHLMFDAHQIVFAENVASESFYPGASAVEMLTASALADMKAAFPAFAKAQSPEELAEIYGPTARPIAGREAARFAKWGKGASCKKAKKNRWLDAA